MENDPLSQIYLEKEKAYLKDTIEKYARIVKKQNIW